MQESKPKVLIADDERVIADTLAAILNHGGFEARAVYSCPEALEIARTFSPDMLIADVIMAGMNGIEAAICWRDKRRTGTGLRFSPSRSTRVS